MPKYNEWIDTPNHPQYKQVMEIPQRGILCVVVYDAKLSDDSVISINLLEFKAALETN